MGTEEDLKTLSMEHDLQRLQQEFQATEKGTNALDVIGIQTKERRLTRFLNWLLDSSESHGAGRVFLNAFLTEAGETSKVPVSVEPFFTVDRGSEDENAEIDLVLVGTGVCLGVEIKTTHQEEVANLNKEYEALKSSFPRRDDHELVYLTYLSGEALPDLSGYPLIFWRDVVNRFEDGLDSVPGDYEKHLISDFIKTVRTHIMTEFNGVSEETELYLKYSDAIDDVQEAYEEDKGRFFDAFWSEFTALDSVEQDEWKRGGSRSKRHMKLYKPAWHSLENRVNIEYEPHVYFKGNRENKMDGLAEPHLSVRLDVEGGEAKTVRDEIMDRLGEAGRDALDQAGFTWFSKDEATYKFISKAVPLATSQDNGINDQDPIEEGLQELQELRKIVEETVDSVVAENT